MPNPKVYWTAASSQDWATVGNWSLNPDGTDVPLNAPWVDDVDTTYLGYDLTLSTAQIAAPTPPIFDLLNVGDQDLGSGATGTCDIAGITDNGYSSINGGTWSGAGLTVQNSANNAIFSGDHTGIEGGSSNSCQYSGASDYVANSNSDTFTGDYPTVSYSNGSLYTCDGPSVNSSYGDTFIGSDPVIGYSGNADYSQSENVTINNQSFGGNNFGSIARLSISGGPFFGDAWSPYEELSIDSAEAPDFYIAGIDMGTSAQWAVADANFNPTYYLEEPDAIPGNILAGKSILGMTGTAGGVAIIQSSTGDFLAAGQGV